METYEDFLKTYARDADGITPSASQIKAFKGKLPDALLDFWKTIGWGSFGDGYLHFFNPTLFQSDLSDWIINPDGARIPFARTSFGEFYYWRDLSSKEEGAGDICLLDIHTSANEVVTYTFENFIHTYVIATESMPRFDLHHEVRNRLPRPSETEFYYFIPALRIGGSDNEKSVDIGDGHIQMSILRQLAG